MDLLIFIFLFKNKDSPSPPPKACKPTHKQSKMLGFQQLKPSLYSHQFLVLVFFLKNKDPPPPPPTTIPGMQTNKQSKMLGFQQLKPSLYSHQFLVLVFFLKNKAPPPPPPSMQLSPDMQTNPKCWESSSWPAEPGPPAERCRRSGHQGSGWTYAGFQTLRRWFCHCQRAPPGTHCRRCCTQSWTLQQNNRRWCYYHQ